MRDLLSKVMTGSMIAGAALLVVACGGSEDATTNNANYIEDPLMSGNDAAVTESDAMNGTTDNLGADANATTTTGADNSTTTTTTTNTTSDTTTTNGL
jgi:hypothetical protein